MGTLQEKGGTIKTSMRYKAPGLESLCRAETRMGIATRQNTQNTGQRKAAIVIAHHVLRRREKSSWVVKVAAIGFANLKTADAITRTTTSSLRASIMLASERFDCRNLASLGSSIYAGSAN